MGLTWNLKYCKSPQTGPWKIRLAPVSPEQAQIKSLLIPKTFISISVD